MENKDSKWEEIIGIVVALAIVGSIVCGILECFSIDTGVIGAICCIVPVLFLVVFVIFQIIKKLNK